MSPWLPAVLCGSPLYLARIWHGRWLMGSTYSPLFPRTRPPLRRLAGVKGGACAIASATPQSGALDAGEPTQDDPGDVEGTETRWALFGVNADWLCDRVPESVVRCR